MQDFVHQQYLGSGGRAEDASTPIEGALINLRFIEDLEVAGVP